MHPVADRAWIAAASVCGQVPPIPLKLPRSTCCAGIGRQWIPDDWPAWQEGCRGTRLPSSSATKLQLVASGLQQAPHQVCKGIGVVKAGVAGWCDHVREVVGGQGEVGNLLKAAVCVLDVHPVVLPCQDAAVRTACLAVEHAALQPMCLCSPLPAEELGVGPMQHKVGLRVSSMMLTCLTTSTCMWGNCGRSIRPTCFPAAGKLRWESIVASSIASCPQSLQQLGLPCIPRTRHAATCLVPDRPLDYLAFGLAHKGPPRACGKRKASSLHHSSGTTPGADPTPLDATLRTSHVQLKNQHHTPHPIFGRHQAAPPAAPA